MNPSPELRLADIDRVDGDELLIQFSDGTSAIYTVEELAGLKPDRTRQAEDQRLPGDSGAGVG